MGDVVFLSSLDLSIFFRVRALRGHHVRHVARELAPGYFDGGRHVSFEERVFLCYDTTGSSDDKSLREALGRSSGMTLSHMDSVFVCSCEKCSAT